MKKKQVSIQYYETDDRSQLPEDEQALLQHAIDMTHNAYAPYSVFFVGAAILLENGEVVKGSNQENGAYPSGLCAERVAAFAASAAYPGVRMKKIAICARTNRLEVKEPVSPCGACRQVLLEYELTQHDYIKVLLGTENGKVLIAEKVEDLLPLSFSGMALKKE
ncbi:MAG: cytidine deaminase [Bacteroidales bacterium]|nr:cytidine deaminase [Bacteroidales bacterium]